MTSFNPDKPAYNIADVARPNGPLSCSEVYKAIQERRLRAKKYGRRTIIERDAWADFLASLPDFPAAA